MGCVAYANLPAKLGEKRDEPLEVSASVLIASTVWPDMPLTTSPGRWALPSGMFSTSAQTPPTTLARALAEQRPLAPLTAQRRVPASALRRKPRRSPTPALSRKIGARADVVEATDRINNHQIDRLANLVARFAKAGTRIALLGLSDKSQTPVVARLADAGYVVGVHDPLAQDNAAQAVFGDKVVSASSLDSAVRECDLLIVATGWLDYKAIDRAWCRRNRQRLLWRTLPAEKFADVTDVLSRLQPLIPKSRNGRGSARPCLSSTRCRSRDGPPALGRRTG